ncbi:TetR-like C-terminal domain-containing protein [Isoptericola sp. b441]|uniref:TetR-like C-terminal domain-containing protein n=1 Tax=Actinotalea lenta TaxID=3064654 RepID=A0ABT9D7J8_9CELL|nr:MULTISPECIES: TetR-like C-terminal domain-containing protein [unclassified Isoptericola]MDO8106835.1 TetR-like C-terminal domain-containing protein [Isoptericola sp. b441]MDO8121454.1 TetR-like C-terminal domain-containing protein [Isoptericola sp. b490]
MPRAGLTPERVVDLALGVLDDDGWDGMTLAAVAGRAGVAVPSLYKHVRGLPDLRRRVALVCVREFDARLRAAAGRSSREPGDAVRAMAVTVRAYGIDHPGRYAAVQGGDWAHDPDAIELEAASAAAVGTIAESLAALDLPADRTTDAIRAVRALVHGFVTLQQSGGFGMPDDVEMSFTRAVDALVAGLAAGEATRHRPGRAEGRPPGGDRPSGQP